MTIIIALLLINSVIYGAEDKKPNIVLILIDDMGWSDLSCFGNKAVETINVDRLAQEGISFTQFYVSSPLCSPSRCGITTGQYPQRWRMTSYLDNRKRNEERGVAQWLDLSAPILARFLQQNGYATGHFGKWHLGGQRDVDNAPLISEYGFDESLTNFEGLGPRILPLLNTFDGTPPRKHALGSDTLGHGEIQWVNRNNVTSSYVNKTLEFIKKAERKNTPFYVNLWTDDVHSPFFPSQELRGDGSKQTRYHGVLTELDRQLAPLLDYIRESHSLRKNTLIIFLSDNGPEIGAGSSQPLRGSKGMLYEGGVRSPLIVWGDGFIASEQKGTKNQTAVFQSIDLVPSLLKITGTGKDPQVTKTIFDGEDFSEILLGRKINQSRQKPIFWRRPPDRPGIDQYPLPDLALRKGAWKFLMQFDGSKQQLYDLEKDVTESINLAESQPELVEELSQILRNWNNSLPKDAGEKLQNSP
ncbi:MAG: sulfatase-like hydrolase/transferase [Planctomycetaceae bacterium]|nr:sulfatase-like hydrolase/transferase [Planctomycetaceae bacterium]